MSHKYNPQCLSVVFTFASSYTIHKLNRFFSSPALSLKKRPVSEGADVVNHTLLIVSVMTAGQRNC